MAAHPFRIHNFRAYWAARLSMTLGQYAMIIIIGWQTYAIARETLPPSAAAARLGLIGLLQFIPLFALTPVVGWVADRLNRRNIARATVSLQLLSALTLALFTYEGAMTLPVLFTIAVLLGVARAFGGPALSALAPNLVPKEVLPHAIALSSISWQVGMIVGPAIGGYAYSFSQSAAYFAATGLFALALVALSLIGKVSRSIEPPRRHPIRQIVEGLQYVWQNKLVLGAITLDLFAVLLAGATALFPVYARDILHVGPRGLSEMAAAPAVGAAITAVIFSFRPLKTNVGPKMLAAVFVFGCATITFGLSRWMPLSLAALAVAGAADMFSVYIRQSLIQLHTPDDKRGRVSAVSQLTISASNELGEAESGFLASLFSPTAAVVIGGTGAILVTALWSRLFPAIRNARTFDPPASLEDQPETMEKA